MGLKQNLVLLIALIIFAGLVVVIERPFDDRTRKDHREAAALFPELKIDQVRKIQVKQPQGATFLENRHQVWYVLGPEAYPADPQAVRDALERIQGLRKINLVATKKEKQAQFEVTAGQGMEVLLLGDGDRKLADLFLGKNGPDLLSTYIRRADSDEVFLYEQYLKSSFDRQLNNWRDKTIFAFDPNQTTEIRISGKQQQTLLLSKDTKGDWHIEQPLSRRADKTRVSQLLETFSRLRAADFAEQSAFPQSGLENPAYSISARLKDGSARTLLVGQKKDDVQYFAGTEPRKYLYLLYKGVVETLTPTFKDLEKSAEEVKNQTAGSGGKKMPQPGMQPINPPLGRE